MAHGGNRCKVEARPVSVTLMDLEEELRRLLESKILLVAMASELGMAIPRYCCPHRGESPCLSCASDWLVAHVRFAKGMAN